MGAWEGDGGWAEAAARRKVAAVDTAVSMVSPEAMQVVREDTTEGVETMEEVENMAQEKVAAKRAVVVVEATEV